MAPAQPNKNSINSIRKMTILLTPTPASTMPLNNHHLAIPSTQNCLKDLRIIINKMFQIKIY